MLRRPRALPAGSLSINPYWLGRGLVSALAFGNTNIIDLTGRNTQSVAYEGGHRYNTAGRGLYLSGAGGAGIPNAALSAGQTVTRIAVLSIDAPNNGGTISADAHGAGSSRLQWSISATGLRILKSGIVEMANFPISASAGKPTVVGFTYNNGAIRGYQDGRLIGTATSAQTFSPYLVAALGQNYNGEQFSGIINLHLDFGQDLTDAEMRFLTANPESFAQASTPTWAPIPPAAPEILDALVATGQGQGAAAAGAVSMNGTAATSQAQTTSAVATNALVAVMQTAQAQQVAAAGNLGSAATVATGQAQSAAGALSAVTFIEAVVQTSQAQGVQAVAGIAVAAVATTGQGQSASASAAAGIDTAISTAQGQSSAALGQIATDTAIETAQAQTVSAEGRAAFVARGALAARIRIQPVIRGTPNLRPVP